LAEDYREVSALYERVLPAVAAALNGIHRIDRSVRYWRILIGPWLAYLIQVSFSRWKSACAALRRGDVFSTIVLTGPQERRVSNNMSEFVAAILHDRWNHDLWSTLLQRFESLQIVQRPCPYAPTPRNHNASWKHALRMRLTALTRPFIRESDVFLAGTYLPASAQWRLSARLGQVPQFWSPVDPPRASVEWRQRSALELDFGSSDYERFLADIVGEQIPTAFLEGYPNLLAHVAALPWPKKPKVIFTSNWLLHDTTTMAYAAEKVEEGAGLLLGQHGGVYGTAAFSWAEDHELSIADRYLTWGWGAEKASHAVPVGVIKLSGPRRQPTDPTGGLLMVLPTESRYSNRLSSEAMLLSEGTLRGALEFVSRVPISVRAAVRVRFWGTDYGWDLKERWLDCHPGVEIDEGVESMSAALRRIRLVVYYCYNGSGFLEAIAQDTPTILLADFERHPLRESAKAYFEALREVGVVQTSIAAAADHVRKVWDDVFGWWQQKRTAEALRSFREQYCKTPEDIVLPVEAAVRAVTSRASRVPCADSQHRSPEGGIRR